MTSDPQFQAFSSGPVQIGDSVVISAGFSAVTWGTYVLTAVNSGWIEFASTESLPLEAGIMPGTSGFTIYSQARRFIHLESDQLITVHVAAAPDLFSRSCPASSATPRVSDTSSYGAPYGNSMSSTWLPGTSPTSN